MSLNYLVLSAFLVFYLFGCVTSFSLGGLINGGGSKQFDEESLSKGEKGDQGYLSFRETEKGAKGHHNKEGRKGFFAEVGGNKKIFRDDNGYNKAHNLAVKGNNGFRYADHASWAKGHNTKGKHSIHKLDELKKKTEYFDEDGDQSFKEKHGGYDEKAQFEKGDKQNQRDFIDELFDANYGLEEVFARGSDDSRIRGYVDENGKNEYKSNGEKFEKAGGSGIFKKWKFNFN